MVIERHDRVAGPECLVGRQFGPVRRRIDGRVNREWEESEFGARVVLKGSSFPIAKNPFPLAFPPFEDACWVVTGANPVNELVVGPAQEDEVVEVRSCSITHRRVVAVARAGVPDVRDVCVDVRVALNEDNYRS